jgi:ferredoxin
MSEPDGAYTLPATGRDGQARERALRGVRDSRTTPTSLVAYRSEGRLLVAGPQATALEVAARLADSGLSVSLLVTDDAAAPPDSGNGGSRVIRARLAAVRGHLGAFEVDVHAEDGVRPLAPSILTANRPYDLVLDLGRTPVLRAELPPPGYFAPAGDARRLEQALAEIPELTGEFEKPRFFDYDPDICAHGARGQPGCSRCLSACPTDAIRSIGERIEVDPHLCQGGGSCATACPTGAIRYAYPPPQDLVERLRALLGAYREAGGSGPVVLFHDGDAGLDWVRQRAAALPENVLPFAVEECGSVGLETWLSVLAFGAGRVALLATGATPSSVRQELAAQIEVADAILRGLGHAPGAVRLLEASAEADLAAELGPSPPTVRQPAAFAGVADKRAALRLALDHLYAQADAPAAEVELPAHALFGEIRVDTAACTLCMACASVCPAGAVLTAGDRPRLDFVEQNCVQCGLCARACPEDAVALRARLVFERERRAARRPLNEDTPFACVGCGKVFGTTRTVERMLDKLSAHWMFQDKPEQLRRLQMCEDCRVKDMFRDGGGLLDVDGGPH